jgi:hypothetical protein
MLREMEVVLVRLPDVPATLIDALPGAAVLLAVKVNVLLLVVLPGLKEAVTPLGNPEPDKLTLPLKPFCGATVMVLVPMAPCRIVNTAGSAESPNVGVAVTVTDTFVVLVKVPELPVIVTFPVPAGAVLLAVKVNVLVVVLLLGLNEAVTPLGRPEAVRLTLPLKPFCGVIVMVLVPLVPCGMLKPAGEPARKKLGPDPGQLFTRLAMLTVPIPVEKSQPVVVP